MQIAVHNAPLPTPEKLRRNWLPHVIRLNDVTDTETRDKRTLADSMAMLPVLQTAKALLLYTHCNSSFHPLWHVFYSFMYLC
jgi:hypothetical protein